MCDSVNATSSHVFLAFRAVCLYFLLVFLPWHVCLFLCLCVYSEETLGRKAKMNMDWP